MDRIIVYPGAIPLDTDMLNTNRNAMVSIAKLAAAIFGTSTALNGLSCVPTGPASLHVLVNPGEIYSLANIDTTSYGSLSSDSAHQIFKQGISLDQVNLSTPPPGSSGQSINYLVQVQYSDTDGGSTVLPYYNSSNPDLAYSGPSNSGTAQNTIRQGLCSISIKAGIAATTGTQTTPSPDAGYTGAWVVTVANGQTTVTSGNITQYSGAPFLTETLLQKIGQTALGNTTDPTKGDAYVGVKRTIAAAVGTTLHTWIEGSHFVATADFGAVGDNATDNSTAFAKAITAATLGGRVHWPAGIYRTSSVNASTPAMDFTTNGHHWFGDGNSTVFKLTTTLNAGVPFIRIKNSAYHEFSCIYIDANGKADETVQFLAEVSNSCGSSSFYQLYLTGALANTMHLAHASSSPDDISHLNFYNCQWRSNNPSNSQIQVSGANALSNNIWGGIIGGPGASPLNVDLLTGQITAFGVFFEGATFDDVAASGGQWQSYGGRSESERFFHSLNTDTTGQEEAPHIIRGMQLSTSGVNSLHHEGQRALLVSGNFCNGYMLIGKGGGAGLPEAALYADGPNFFAGGFDYVVQGNGSLYQNGKASNNTAQAGISQVGHSMATAFTNSARPVLTDNSATPSVAGGNVFVCSNSSPTTITNLTNGYDPQEVTIVFTNSNTTIADSAPFFLNGNFTSTANDVLKLVQIGTSWYEVSRSLN